MEQQQDAARTARHEMDALLQQLRCEGQAGGSFLPYLSSECDDPLFSGRLRYTLHPGQSILVGGGEGCGIVLGGLCIPEQGLCMLQVADDLCSVTCSPAYGRRLRFVRSLWSPFQPWRSTESLCLCWTRLCSEFMVWWGAE